VVSTEELQMPAIALGGSARGMTASWHAAKRLSTGVIAALPLAVTTSAAPPVGV
jgi:hypothetical protein